MTWCMYLCYGYVVVLLSCGMMNFVTPEKYKTCKEKEKNIKEN